MLPIHRFLMYSCSQMSIIKELKRRNVFRVGTAYIVTGWLLVQVAETVFPLFGLGDGPTLALVIVLFMGFAPVLVFSWAFELTPEGLKKESQVDRSQSVTVNTGKRLNRITISVLALALAYFAFDKFFLSSVREATIAETAHEQGRTKAIEEAFGASSIAVLPFVNMSDDAANEYFSDGISEELLNLLARIPELRVISRSSAFAYKNKDINIQQVAKELNVAHVLEGSVRKVGNQVRITAQLIDGRTDAHLWSETYDRSLNDVFAIQDEVAAMVVEKLKLTLLGDTPTVQATDPEAYALYLKGRHLRQQRTPAGTEQALSVLQQSLEIDADYAAAWVELARVYDHQINLSELPFDEGIALQREALNTALANDPHNALAHTYLGRMASRHENDPVAAARHLERALELEPTNPEAIRAASGLNASVGRMGEAIRLIEYVVARDPVNPHGYINQGLYYVAKDRPDDGIDSFNTALTLSPGIAAMHYCIAIAELMKGDIPGAYETMQLEDSIWRMVGLPVVYHAMGMEEESDAALADLIEKHEQHVAYNVAYILAYRGEADEAFEWLEKSAMNMDPGLSEMFFQPLFANLYDDPRWALFLESVGKSPEQIAALEFEVMLPE